LGAFAGGEVSMATALNDSGQIVGAAQHGDGRVTAFLWQAGRMHDIGMLPGDGKARAYSINNSGEVVGASYIGEINHTSNSRAFLWDADGGIRDLGFMLSAGPTPRQRLVNHMSAYAINDSNEILGVCINGTRSFFLLLPARLPEHGSEWPVNESSADK